jgi:hypothetical protein
MSFLAVGAQTSEGFQAGGWNSGTEIAFVDVPSIETSYLQRTVYHEFGHNWDEASETSLVTPFREQSGWVEIPSALPGFTASTGVGDNWYYLTSESDTFAREYGKTNPLEDMASTWEAYFVNEYHGGAAGLEAEGLTLDAGKQVVLDALFGILRAQP